MYRRKRRSVRERELEERRLRLRRCTDGDRDRRSEWQRGREFLYKPPREPPASRQSRIFLARRRWAPEGRAGRACGADSGATPGSRRTNVPGELAAEDPCSPRAHAGATITGAGGEP